MLRNVSGTNERGAGRFHQAVNKRLQKNMIETKKVGIIIIIIIMLRAWNFFVLGISSALRSVNPAVRNKLLWFLCCLL